MPDVSNVLENEKPIDNTETCGMLSTYQKRHLMCWKSIVQDVFTQQYEYLTYTLELILNIWGELRSTRTVIKVEALLGQDVEIGSLIWGSLCSWWMLLHLPISQRVLWNTYSSLASRMTDGYWKLPFYDTPERKQRPFIYTIKF